jgi:hypothetical protein
MTGSRPRPTRFVVLAAPRSGSNMLCSLLNSHPQVLCHHEIFNPGGIYYALPLRQNGFSIGTLEDRDADPLTFLERVWATPLGRAAVGFKMTCRQNPAVFRRVLDDKGVRKIVLRRRNRVKALVSTLVAERTGVWEAYREADVPRCRPKVRVTPQALREHVRADDAYYAEIDGVLRLTAQTYLRVAYERLGTPDERVRVLRFLGVRPDSAQQAAAMTAASVKQNPPDLREVVENFAELLASVRGTSLEAELCSLEN